MSNFPSPARTPIAVGTTASATVTVQNVFRSAGFVIYINVASVSGGDGVQVNINAIDPASGNAILILASATLSSASSGTPTRLRVHPSLSASANVIAQDIAPDQIQIVATVTGSGAISYSVGMVWVD